MGLFDDTIRDARRPLPGTWVRREMLPEKETPEEEPLEPAAPSGMTTIFRFQKGGPPAAMEGGSREASFRLGVGESDLPAGDPLSVGSEVERPDFSAKDVNGNRDIISVLGDNRGNELATGQVNHGSPGKRTAAEMITESRTHQSEVVPGPVESDSVHQTHKSLLPEGSGRFVSEQEETYQSRASGQGAPSDSFTAPVNPLRSAQPGTTADRQPEGMGNPRLAAMPSPGLAGEWGTGNPARGGGLQGGVIAPAGGQPNFPETGKGQQIEADVTPRPVPPLRGATPAIPSSRLDGMHVPAEHGPPRTSGEEQPWLVIGRLEVVVVNNEQSSPRSVPVARTDTGFVSRNYLKRL
jgi:hypothetical protein